MSVLLTYHREGDSEVLYQLACAYELLRDHMTPGQRDRFASVVLQRMLNDIMLEPIYRYNHNNLYQWHRTVIQTAVALEREDLIDWSFGYGAFDRRASTGASVAAPSRGDPFQAGRRLLGDVLRIPPLSAQCVFCELAVISRNLSRHGPASGFRPRQYDLTAPANPGSAGDPQRPALVHVHGDAGSDDADDRGFDGSAGGHERLLRHGGSRLPLLRPARRWATTTRLRNGERSWGALLYGCAEIVSTTAFLASSYLSSGWVSLRNEWQGNRVWIGPERPHSRRRTPARRLACRCELFARQALLALEKATPYNEMTLRLGTFRRPCTTR